MATILLILPEIGRATTIAESLKLQYQHTVLVVKSEADAFAYLCIHVIDIIIIDPLLPPDFLFENPNYTLSEKTEIGEIGFILLSNLKKEIVTIQSEPKVILFSIVDLKDLVRVGFDPLSRHVRRGSTSGSVLPKVIEEVLDLKHLKN